MNLDCFFLLRRPVLSLLLTLAASAAYAAPITLHSSANGQGSAVLELDADELVTMTMIPFRLVFKDHAGHPLSGAPVRCDMTMPAMTMPENRPQVAERDGVYVGEMIFPCAMGAWRITCVAEKGNGSSQTAIFDIEKVRMK
jgi:hypothetical protein